MQGDIGDTEEDYTDELEDIVFYLGYEDPEDMYLDIERHTNVAIRLMRYLEKLEGAVRLLQQKCWQALKEFSNGSKKTRPASPHYGKEQHNQTTQHQVQMECIPPSDI